jgi:uncharacterized protein (UPF0276 family)
MYPHIATPFSNLFDDQQLRERLLEVSDVVEIRNPEQANKSGKPEIYHCSLSLVANWHSSDKESLRGLRDAGLKLISFHVSSRYAKNKIVDGRFCGCGKPFTRNQMLKNAAENIAYVQSIFGDSIPILVENNNDLKTSAYEIVTDPEFLSQIIQENSLCLLLDIAHAKISAYNRGLTIQEYLANLPLSKVVQVHLARHIVQKGFAYDAHEFLLSSDWDFFCALLPRVLNLSFITIEYYRDGSRLLSQIAILDEILKREFREYVSS